MSHVMAIDAGTGSIRAVIFTLDGQLVQIAQRSWEHKPEPGVPGSMAFTTDENYALMVECIEEALSLSGVSGSDIKAVSASAMREGFVVLDAQGTEIWACANVDSRANEQVSHLFAQEGVVEELYALSGQTPALAAQPRLLWLKENRPDVYESAHTVLMLSEWVLFRLSGARVMEPSNGSTSGLLAMASRDVDPRLAVRAGIRDDLVPQVLEPGSVVGTVRPDVAAQTGLGTNTLVVVGGGDAQLAALGLGLTKPGQVLLTAGTFWQLNVNLGAPVADPNMKIRVNMAAVPGVWQAEAIAFHPGTAVRWFRDTFAVQETAAAKEQGRNPLDLLCELAAEIPIGSGSVVPIFSDVMNYDRWTHAAPSFLNLGLEGGPRLRAAMFRSLLENAAIVSDANLQLVSSFAPINDSEPVTFAGGAANSLIWSQITADVLGKDLQIPAVTEATAQGTAACAASAVLEGTTPAEVASRWLTWSHTVSANMSAHEQYNEVKDRWRAAYGAQLELANAGVTSPLWRAPGA
ncbi:autoinducer-2 kinase [Timonella senegalensis]|uniref:autoinducer-2 kinase n=1 Tax=Timonella senegalensis TaxID=1465825 RepID=UPI0002EFBBE6|nr:autoinducer-2 kinase [Timonella senegalensis]